MAGKQSEWWSCKLKYLEANYERCKLKVRQDSLYCKMFILEYQNRLEEEKRITLKYEKSAACQRLQQAEQKHLELSHEKELTAKKAVEDLANVEGKWKEKTNELMKKIESLQEENEKEIRSKDNYILELTNEVHGLRKLLQSKETCEAKNAVKQRGSKGEFDKTKKTHAQDTQKTTNTSEAQGPDLTANTVSESTSKNSLEESNVVLDNSGSTNGEKLLESEVGSVLEVTEEMLKSCRRRSVLKRKKSEVCDFVPENDDSDNVELSEFTKLDKSRRERRVTFNGELEFKLPDGSKEVGELETGESDEQTDDDQNGGDVFDDILSRETEVVGEGLDDGCNAAKEIGVGGNLDELVLAKTKNLEKVKQNDREAKNETGFCENREGGEESQEEKGNHVGDALNKNLAEDSQRMGLRKRSETEDTAVVGQNNDKNENNKKQSKEDQRSAVEADILFSANSQSEDVQLNAEFVDSGEPRCNTKTESKEGPSKELLNAQLGETDGREKNYGPKRTLRSCGNKDKKPSKRLLDVFGSEVQPNQASKEETRHSRSRKAQRKPKENKKKISNVVARNESVNIPDEQQNEEGEAALESEIKSNEENEPQGKITQSKKTSRKTNKTEVKEKRTTRKRRALEKASRKIRQSLVIENEQCKNEKTQEHAGEDLEERNCLPKQLSSLPTTEVKDDVGKEQTIIDEKCEEKDHVQHEKNVVSEHGGKKHNEAKDEVFIGKKSARKRVRVNIDERDDLDSSDEVKEKEATPCSKKRKSPEPETNEERNGGKENENENHCGEIDDKGGILDKRAPNKQRKTNLRSKAKIKSEKRAKNKKNYDGIQDVENEDVEETKTAANEITIENKQEKTNRKSKKRKSREFEMNENQKQNDDALDMKEVTDDEKPEQINESEINEAERKTTRGSKKRKSSEREIEEIVDVSKPQEAVGLELVHQETSEEISKRKPAGRKTKTSKRKSDTVVINSAVKTAKARRGKKKETVNETNEGGKESAVESEEVDGEEKENNRKTSSKRGGRERVLVETDENETKVMDKDDKEKMENGAVDEMVDSEKKENYGGKTKAKGRKQEPAETGKNEIKENGDEGERCEKRRTTTKCHNEETCKDEKRLPGKADKQEKPIKKKRRTLYSIRESTTFFNATSSIFQETLPVNQTRSSTGMPPSLSSFMKAFVIPKLKKK